MPTGILASAILPMRMRLIATTSRPTCAHMLFVPVISKNTESRREGYFRLEWKLAVDRSHLIADDQAFIMGDDGFGGLLRQWRRRRREYRCVVDRCLHRSAIRLDQRQLC